MSKLIPTGYETCSGVEYMCPECGFHMEIPEDHNLPEKCPNCDADLVE